MLVQYTTYRLARKHPSRGPLLEPGVRRRRERLGGCAGENARHVLVESAKGAAAEAHGTESAAGARPASKYLRSADIRANTSEASCIERTRTFINTSTTELRENVF